MSQSQSDRDQGSEQRPTPIQQKMDSSQEPKNIGERQEKVETMIDETVDESFPASDPPAWGAVAKKDADVQREKSKQDQEDEQDNPDLGLNPEEGKFKQQKPGSPSEEKKKSVA